MQSLGVLERHERRIKTQLVVIVTADLRRVNDDVNGHTRQPTVNLALNENSSTQKTAPLA